MQPASVRLLVTAPVLGIVWLLTLLNGGVTSTYDQALLASLYARGEPVVIAVATFFSHLGGWYILIPATLAGALWLVNTGRRSDALLLLLISIGGRMMVELQKFVSNRLRPPEPDQLVAVHSLSFPSGHAANSMTVYLALALLLLPRAWAVLGALGLSLLIGLSRPVLGVHWPTDVIGGWAFGIVWTLALLRFAGRNGTAPPLRN